MNNIRAIRAAVMTFGTHFPEGALDVFVYGEEIEVNDKIDDYEGKSYWISSVYLGEGWSAELVTKEAFEAFVRENPTYYKNFENNQKAAMQTLANLAVELQEKIIYGLNLAQEFSLDFDVDLDDHGELQLTKAAAVDWNSSSLYC